MSFSILSFYKKLEKNEKILILSILLAALFFRVLYWNQIKDSPSLYQHSWSQTDMSFFYLWAGNIASGDWLTNKSLHPYMEWQKQLTDSEDKEYVKNAHSSKSAKSIWDEWYGYKRFHQEPLYPYFLALVFKFFGNNVQQAFAIQFLLGIINILLIYLITRRFFGMGSALVAALMALLYGPFIFYEGVLLRPVMIIFTTLLAFWVLTIAIDSKRAIYFILVGLLLGICILVKSTIFIFILPTLFCLAFYFRNDVRQSVSFISLLAAGIFLAISPLIMRNLIVGVTPFALSSVGADSIISANAGDFSPGTGFNVSTYFLPIMEKAKGKIIPTLYYTLRTHSSISSFIQQLFEKFLIFWNWYEIPNNINYYYQRLYSSLLSRYQITFAVLGPMAFFGLIFAVRTIKKTFLLCLLAFSGILSNFLFYNLSRFRTPVVASLIPFAAYFLVFIVNEVRKRKYIIVAIVILILAFLIPQVFLAPPKSEDLIRAVDFRVGNAISIARAEELARHGAFQSAVKLIEKTLKTEPKEVMKITSTDTTTLKDGRLLLLAESFAEMHRVSAQLNEKLLNEEKTEYHYERFRKLNSFVKNSKKKNEK